MAQPHEQHHELTDLSLYQLDKVYETAYSAVSSQVLGHPSANLRFVCTSFYNFANKAYCDRQALNLKTHTTKCTTRGSVALEPSYALRRQFSTHTNPVYEASFHIFLAEGEEADDNMGDSKSVTSTTSSAKRKRGAGPAFYAVRVGRTPGIYYSWSDCEAQIRGVKADCRLSDYRATNDGLTENRQEVRLPDRCRGFLERHTKAHSQAWEDKILRCSHRARSWRIYGLAFDTVTDQGLQWWTPAKLRDARRSPGFCKRAQERSQRAHQLARRFF